MSRLLGVGFALLLVSMALGGWCLLSSLLSGYQRSVLDPTAFEKALLCWGSLTMFLLALAFATAALLSTETT